MKVSKFVLLGLLLAVKPLIAHDEGHGPKLSDTGKYGGLVSAIVNKKDAKLGAKAPLVYKAELVRASDGKIMIYLYDSAMKPLDAVDIDKKASVSMAFDKKGVESKSFEITFDGKAFSGKMPEPAAKPYNLDFLFKAKDLELLTAFDNLD